MRVSSFSRPGLIVLFFAISVFLLAGCGGAGGGNGFGGGGGTNPPNPTITSVAVSAPASITLAQTATCSATVTGTGAYSSAVSWTATNGTITSGGVLTPAAVGTATCTATSTADTTKSGSASVAVNAVPPTITSVSVIATPSAITTTQTSQCTATVTGTGAFNPAVTWSQSGGTITSSGVFTPSALGTGGTGSCTATSVQDATKVGSASIAVSVAVPTVTSVNVTCSPSTISTADTTTCTAVVNGTGNPYQQVSWGATGGIISPRTDTTADFAPSGTNAETATVTATSTQPGYTNISGSVSIAVTAAKPVITSISVPVLYCDADCPIVGGIHINGSGFVNGDTISVTPDAHMSSQLDSSNQISVSIWLYTAIASPGWYTFKVCTSDGVTCSSSTIAFIGNQNSLALDASGELYSLDMAGSTIWKYKPDGTADGSVGVGHNPGIATDDKTGDILVAQTSDPALYVIGPVAVTGNGNGGIAVGARNGNGCITQPSPNYLSCVNLLVTNTNQPFNSITAGSQPWSLAMGLFGTETDALIFSRSDGVFWKFNVSGGNPILKGSLSLPGITPYATLYQQNPLSGGWQVVVFDKGPASGTAAVLSTADQLLFFVNTTTMQMIGQPIKLTGVPFRIAKDETHGNLIVAYADTANARTTFAAVNPTTQVVTPLTSTSTLLATGLQVSLDGNNIDACQRAQCQVLPNQ